MIHINMANIKISKRTQLDKNVLSVLSPSVWLCGGAMRSILDKKSPVDYDLFFETKMDAVITKNKLESMGFKKVFTCPMGQLVTYLLDTDGILAFSPGIKVQVITKRYYTSMEECLSTFDFNATAAGTDGTWLVCKKEWISDNRKKTLSINTITYPSASIARLHKYKQYGFHIGEAIQDIVNRIWNNHEDIIDMSQLYID